MGLAEYRIIPKGNSWSVLHDGAAPNEYETKEAAFESAIAAASLALREGHEVRVSVPGREAGEDAQHAAERTGRI
jgi:phosphotransferase system HPr-like phosphotransfer protein